MNIAFASGKGGTGKTTLSTNLAQILSKTTQTAYLDCDVEEPNGHLFLNPVITDSFPVYLDIPLINPELCRCCGECSCFCRANAIASIKDATLVFAELCRSCGGCIRVCPAGAITEEKKVTGTIEKGHSGNLLFTRGRMLVGHASAPRIIRELVQKSTKTKLAILDAPPGTSCPAAAAIREADLVYLVTEPTPFGLHDLKLAVNLVRDMNKPFRVIINRCDSGDDRLEIYCRKESIPITGRIPDDRRIAESYSSGRLIVDTLPEYRNLLKSIADSLREVTV